MKLLHTADWHLGDKLGTVDRTADQFRSLERLLAYCDEHKVETLLVAGDVFNEYQGDTLALLVRGLAERLSPHLRRGMHVQFVTGNHDREYLFQLVDTLQALVGNGSTRAVRFASRPSIVTLPDATGRFKVQFVLAPYPTSHRYLPPDAGVRGLGLAERRQALADAFRSKLAAAQEDIDPTSPAVLVSHVYVRTAETSSLLRLSEDQDIPIEPQDLPRWAYVALGHVHLPQAVGGNPSVRYSGSLERLDAGEAKDEKSCVLLEIGPTGLVGEPTVLPLAATPIYSVSVDGSDGLDALAARFPDHAEALVKLSVVWRPGEDNPAAMISRLQTIFPRCYSMEVRPANEPPKSKSLAADSRDVGGTVREYLEQRLVGHPGRDRLLERAAELVREVEIGTAAH